MDGKNITITFDKTTYGKIKEEAKEEKRSMSAQVIYIVSKFFKEKIEEQAEAV